MKKLAALFIVFCHCLSVQSQVFDVDTILYRGSSNKYINIVLLSDGYQASELDKFISDAESFKDDFLLERPFNEYQSHFNFFAIKVPSNESGASHPGTANDVTEPAHPISVVDNYFGSRFDVSGIHRLLVAQKVNKIAGVLVSNFPAYDQVVVLVNSPYYGGSGGIYATGSVGVNANELVLHELGHSFTGLADEYYAGDGFAREDINMTRQTDPTLVKWKNWYGDNAIGIYQHCCGGNSAQWYRPHQNCKMRYLGAPFCSVCVEGTIEKIHQLSPPLIDYSPENSTVSVTEFPVNFGLNLIKPIPNTLQVEWYIDNEPFARLVDLIKVYEEDIHLGTSSVTVNIVDTTTLLRVDNHETIHIRTVTWTIESLSTGLFDIRSDEATYNIELYPNPVSKDILNIKVDSDQLKTIDIIVYDMSGTEISSKSKIDNKALTLEVGSFSNGIYVIEFASEGKKIASRKFVKE